MQFIKSLALFIVALTTLIGCAASTPATSAPAPEAAAASPALVIEPASGAPGSDIIVNGQGFPAGAAMSIHLAPPNRGLDSTSHASATIGEDGAFRTSFTMPATWASGQTITEPELVVVAKNGDGSIKASAPFRLEQPESDAPVGEKRIATAEAEPLATEQCEQIRAEVVEILAVEVSRSEGPVPYVNDAVAVSGQSCQLVAAGNGTSFTTFVEVAGKLRNLFLAKGWAEDMAFLADGPTGMMQGFREESRLAVVRVEWFPSREAQCPAEQPITECAATLTPEQRLFLIQLDLLQ